jgi:hypothetical protein
VGSVRYGMLYPLFFGSFGSLYTRLFILHFDVYIRDTFCDQNFGYKHIDMKTYFYLTLSVPCFGGVLFVICPFSVFLVEEG